MIGYYINCSDEVCDMFNPYIWEEHGLGTLLKRKVRNTDYGGDLNLLLIQYYVEGKFSSYIPAEPKPGNYMKKNKDISVAIGVTPDVFHNRNEFERREFVVDSTINAINIVKNRLTKKKLDIDFDKLLVDVQAVAQEYLKQSVPYSAS